MKYSLLILTIILFGFSSSAQKLKIPKKTSIEVASKSDTLQAMLDDYEKVNLPPLSVFLESVKEHPSTRIYEARVIAADADLKLTQRNWLNYLRFVASYQFGMNNTYSTYNNPDTPINYGNDKATGKYNVGVNINFSLGDLLNQKQKVRKQKAALVELQYNYEITVEERKLIILQAYNKVLEELAVIKAKSESAALYNAQMKISEQDFINGKIDIISLSLERARRSAALVSYQQGKVSLHNAITLLEMLTNVTIMKK